LTTEVISVDVSNVLNEKKKQEVLALGRLGWSLRRIEKETGIRRETIAGYLKTANIAVRPPGRWGKKRAQPPDSKPANGVTTDFGGVIPANEPIPDLDPNPKPANEVIPDSGPASPAPPKQTPSASEPYRELIEQAMSRGRNAKAIWQDLVDDHGFTGGYQSVKRFIHKLHGSPEKQPRAIIVTVPGEEAQVDYGEGPRVRDSQSGRYRRTRLFVLTLGYSRKCVRLIVFTSSTRTWAELHESAFTRIGGVPRVVILDNLREGVLKPDIYDPTINPLYRDMLAHYQAIALPCRIKDPDRKGKVESSVGHAQKTPLKGQRFETIKEAQAYLDRWEEHWADTRIHGTTKRQVGAMFAEEKPALLPLPIEPFRYYQYGERAVHMDGCVEVEAAYYSAPPGWIGRRVNVQWDQRHVRLLDPKTGQLLREHLREPRGAHRILPEDRHKKTPLTTQQLLRRAENASDSIGAFAKTMYAQQGQPAVRRIQGILSLARKYGVAAVDDACSAARAFEVYEYPFVRRYLERKGPTPLSLRQVDPLIRQLTLYRDVIEQRTQSQSEQPNLEKIPNESD
jgi:transposase